MSDQLVAIDDALETGVADHHDPLTRELQELALALRADAPEADADFERRLRVRVERGFQSSASSGRRPLWARFMTPALATGLVVLPLVLIAVLAGGSGQSGDESGGGGGSVVAESGGATAARFARRRRRRRRRRKRSRGACRQGAQPGAGSRRRTESTDRAAVAPWSCPRTAASRPASAIARSSARSDWSWRCPSTRWREWPSRSRP